MKIHGSDGPSPTSPAERGRPTAAPDGAFGALLKETLSCTAAPPSAAASTGIRLGPIVRPISGADAPDVRVERFIDLLDDYRARLADSRVSLKQLEPIARSIEHETRALEPALGQLPEGDPLKDILTSALVTAQSEMARYRRGDYLTA